MARLGEGGMGAVYEARESPLAKPVALKTLTRLGPSALYRFKREFRALADIHHEHLVPLHELFEDDGIWYFTMDLVRGASFDAWVRPTTATYDETRLRDALGQLARAVGALHRAGKWHRDLKPSNVLVRDDGRVVVLDFGVVAEADGEATGRNHRTTQIVGTPAFMAPEQARGDRLSEAADWYSVGVMLYLALTGRLPFEGTPDALLQQKTSAPPPSPCARGFEVAEDLDRLCLSLLQPDPGRRAGFAAVSDCAGRPVAGPRHERPRGDVFVGRAVELASLRAAHQRARNGDCSTVFVSGPSGIGKSALVREFLAGLSSDVVVLTGRCYAQEFVRFKACDGIIDALSRYLSRRPPAELELLIPRQASSLSDLFPVFGQVPGLRRFGSSRSAGEERPGAADTQRLAFSALKELLRRLALDVPLVIHVDDLQWGDLDSALLLAELLGPPAPPALLFVGSHRSDELERSEFLRAFTRLTAQQAPSSEPVHLMLGVLDMGDAVDLARRLVGPADGMAEVIARESEGSPFFLHNLARYHLSRVSDGSGAGMPLYRDALCAQVGELGAIQASVLRVLAVAGHPMEPRVAIEAAGGNPGDAPALSASLCARGLARVHRSGDEDSIELYHDRIREGIDEDIAEDERRSLHGRIAAALEATGASDPEHLAQHYRAAGNLRAAAACAVAAAERADRGLAFHRTAELYRQALEASEAPLVAHELHRRMGDALANAGRRRAAADAYIAGADRASGNDRRRLRQAAAVQLLRCGRLEEGKRLGGQVLTEIGAEWPSTLRGVSWAVRGYAGFSLERLTRRRHATLNAECARALVAFGNPLLPTDIATGSAMLGHVLTEPEGSVEPAVEQAALCWGAISLGLIAGTSADAPLARMLSRARHLADRLNTPFARALPLLAQGAADYFRFRQTQALQAATEAHAILHDECSGVTWELSICEATRFAALEQVGPLRPIGREAARVTREARERDDLYGAPMLGTVGAFGHLLNDEPEAALGLLDEACAVLPTDGALRHLLEVRRVEALLYAGEPRSALAHWRDWWPRFRWSLESRSPYVQFTSHYVGANVALGAYRSEPDPTLLDDALRAAHAIERVRLPTASAAGAHVRGTVSYLRGDATGAEAKLRLAEQGYRDCQIPLQELYARRARAFVMRDGRGRTLLDETAHALREHGVIDVDRWSDMKVPGFARPR